MMMDARAEETFEAVGGYTDGLIIPETPEGSYCYYFLDACNSPYILANAYSDFYDIATCSLVFGKGDNVDYAQADLNAVLQQFRDKGIEVVEDSETYNVTVYNVNFEHNGYKLELQYYLLSSGLIRLDIAFGGYEIPARDYTAEEVANDINAAFASNGYSFGLEWDEDDKEYYLGLNFGNATTATEALLANAVDILESYFPAYLKQKSVYFDDPSSPDYQNILGANIAALLATYETPDGAVRAQIISYVYNKKLTGQLHVYNVADLGE